MKDKAAIFPHWLEAEIMDEAISGVDDDCKEVTVFEKDTLCILAGCINDDDDVIGVVALEGDNGEDTS